MRQIPLLVVVLTALVPARGAEPPPRAFGLETRTPWTTSRVAGSPDLPPPYRAEKIYPKLVVKQPLTFEAEPGTRDYLVIQHLGGWAPPGKILRVPDDQNAEAPQILLEIPGIAYGLDYAPDYEKTGYVYVGMNLTDPADKRARTRVSRYTVGRDAPRVIDPRSEVVIIDWESDGHNGGDLAFGNDGMLYVSSGDGTSDSDLNLRGQDLTRLTAKVLRIDVNHPDPGKAYSVPKDNPFVDVKDARPETWAYGLRNPWRLSFDRASNQLWCGMNGQDLWESVYLIERGANYGWSRFEGSHPFLADRKLGPTPVSPPTAEHHHSEARSLTGGLVYHGKVLPELEGAYIYGDFSTGKVWAIKHDGKSVVWHREIADTPLQLTGFGLDRHGNLVVIDHQTGFYKLVPNTSARAAASAAPSFPRRLSETGLFASVPNRTLAPGLIPYSVNSPFWSDGAAKERAMGVPGLETVGFTGGTQGWNFPNGSVVVKTFLLESKPIETRIMTRQENEWAGYTYVWDEFGTDAVLAGKDGLDRDFVVSDPSAPGGKKTQTWHYPSRAECMVCHSRAANWTLGLSEGQMNRDHDYSSLGGTAANQLSTLEHIGLFTEKLPKAPEQLTRLVNPADTSADLSTRVRSYLSSNCSNCHVSAGGGNAAIDLSFGASLASMGVVDVAPQHETFGRPDSRIVAPGRPDHSTLFQRVSRRGPGQMPPLASSVVDTQAVELIKAWILDVKTPEPVKVK